MSLTIHLNFTPGGGAFYALLYLLLVLGFALLVWYLPGRRKRRIRKILQDETPLSAEEFEENWMIRTGREAGEGYKYHVFPGCYHCFELGVPDADYSKVAYQLMYAALKKAFTQE